jgi:hypothetical protein
MAYTDFTLESVDTQLGVKARPGDLFPDVQPVPVPAWLREMLDRGLRQALLSEKARGEFLVVPLLLATQEVGSREVAIFSGQRLDVDQKLGLLGECDFILAATPPLPALVAPILIIVEAKKNDVENGIAQCMAQMVGARQFNERTGRSFPEMYGCVTTGEAWQFLRLVGSVVEIDRRRLYVDNVGQILAVLVAVASRALSGTGPVAAAG